MFYQNDDSVTYDPKSRHVSITDNLYVGMNIRFSYPDYNYSHESSIRLLKPDKTYNVSNYMIYMNGLFFYFEEFPGECFDAKLFTLDKNDYIVSFECKVKFRWNRFKRRFC